MREQHEALREQGVQIVAVSPDAAAESRGLAADLGLPFPLLSDADRRVAATFGLTGGGDVLPGAFLLDRRGRVQWAAIGRHPADQPSPRAVLAVLTKPHPLPVPAPSTVLTPVVASVTAVVFLLLGLLAALVNHQLLAGDVPLRDAIRNVDAAWFGSLMRATTRLGSRWLIAGLTIPMIAVAWRRCRQLAIVLAGAFPAGLALELLLKTVVDRPRPALAGGFGASFPSGHVLAAAAFWGLIPAWVYLVTRRRWAWAASAALSGLALAGVGLSRVYLGHHWPSDVVGGYLVGAVFLLAAEWAVRRPWAALGCDACDLHPLRGGGVRRPPRDKSRQI